MKEFTETFTVNMATVKDITDSSGSTLQRAHIHFKNGYKLRVMQGAYTYGGKQGLYEIAPFNIKGEMDGSLLDKKDQGDDTCGCCTIEKVNHYIAKLGNL